MLSMQFKLTIVLLVACYPSLHEMQTVSPDDARPCPMPPCPTEDVSTGTVVVSTTGTSGTSAKVITVTRRPPHTSRFTTVLTTMFSTTIRSTSAATLETTPSLSEDGGVGFIFVIICTVIFLLVVMTALGYSLTVRLSRRRDGERSRLLPNASVVGLALGASEEDLFGLKEYQSCGAARRRNSITFVEARLGDFEL